MHDPPVAIVPTLNVTVEAIEVAVTPAQLGDPRLEYCIPVGNVTTTAVLNADADD